MLSSPLLVTTKRISITRLFGFAWRVGPLPFRRGETDRGIAQKTAHVSTHQDITKSKVSTKQKERRVRTGSAESTCAGDPSSMRKMLGMQKTKSQRMEGKTKRRITQKPYGQIYDNDIQRRSAGKI